MFFFCFALLKSGQLLFMPFPSRFCQANLHLLTAMYSALLRVGSGLSKDFPALPLNRSAPQMNVVNDSSTGYISSELFM